MKPDPKKGLSKGLKAKSDAEVLRLLRQSHQLRPRRRLRRALTSTGKPKAPDWTVQEHELLGKLPDAEVAKRLGRTRAAVTIRRYRLGIPNYIPIKRWMPEELALLGTKPDRIIAKELGRTIIAVTFRRAQLKIPNIIEGYHRWLPEEDARLGKQPDEEIAHLLGISVMAVRHRRQVLKIYFRPSSARPHLEWTADKIALLGTAPDAEIARRLTPNSPQGSIARNRPFVPSAKNWRLARANDRCCGNKFRKVLECGVQRRFRTTRVPRFHLNRNDSVGGDRTGRQIQDIVAADVRRL